MPMNVGPDPSFMQRMLGTTNAVGQQMGGPMGQTSRMSAGMNQNRMRRNQPGVMPSRQIAPNMGMLAPGGEGMNVQPNMPIVQGPSQMPPVLGGGMNVPGGMMGGFPRQQVDTGNMINDQPMGNGLWSKYMSGANSRMQPMFR